MKSPAPVMRTILFAMAFNAVINGASAASPRLNQARAWENTDADRDGALTREEARRMPVLARRFDAIDGNRDGIITATEVRQWRESLKPLRRQPAARGAAEMIRVADSDGDGSISRAEFARALPRQSPRFDGLDFDRNGSLGRDELERWFAERRAARSSK